MQPRLLVLEDDPDMRTILQQILEDQGYDVVAVERGEDAVQAARDREFDLVVADIRMEGMSGLEAVRQARQHQPGLGALIVSGYATAEETGIARQLEVGGILKKPFSMERFLEMVRNQLATRQHHERRQQGATSAKESLLWALKTLTEVAREPAAERAAEVARRLAEAQNLDKSVLDELQAAASLLTLSRLNRLTLPRDTMNTLTPTLALALQYAEERYDADPPPPFEARLVALAVEASAEGPLPSASVLAARDPGRLDPTLLALYERPAEERQHGAQSDLRPLLNLALTLERVGDRDNAENAFREVEARAEGREAVEALLGRARIAHARKDAQALHELTSRVPEQARKLGPLAAANALLEAGLLLYRGGSPEARNLLRTAGPLLKRLGLMGGAARAGIALAKLGDDLDPEVWKELLQALLDPVHAAEVAWLVPDALDLLHKSGEHPDIAQRLSKMYPEAQETALRVHSLGMLQVFRRGAAVEEREWKTQKTRFFFGLLAASWGRFLVEDEIIETFWPGDGEKGKKNLYWSTSVVRRCLGAPEAVERKAGGLRLNPDFPRWHDLEELERLLKAPPRRATLRQALLLYTGPFLEGCYDDWALQRRGELERKMVRVACKLAELALEENDPQEGVEAAERALALEPCDQEAYLLAMRAHLEQNRPEAAIEQFRRAESTLKRELGIEPITALIEHYHRARLSLPG